MAVPPSGREPSSEDAVRQSGIILRFTVGVILIALGLVQLGRLPSPMHAVERLSQPITRQQARLRRERPVAGFALFGFGYVLAGFG